MFQIIILSKQKIKQEKFLDFVWKRNIDWREEKHAISRFICINLTYFCCSQAFSTYIRMLYTH